MEINKYDEWEKETNQQKKANLFLIHRICAGPFLFILVWGCIEKYDESLKEPTLSFLTAKFY
jgi:hypothetical protein